MGPRILKFVVNLWPPFMGAGIRVRHIADDWSTIEVQMTLRWFNKNYVGTQFGGSLFSMTDPFYMLMLIKRLGPDYRVWDQRGEIKFIRPGRGTVSTQMTLTEAQLDDIRGATADGAKHFASFDMNIVDADGAVVAKVRKTIYIRKREVSTTA